MKPLQVYTETYAQAYEILLRTANNLPDNIISPRGFPCRELTNVTMSIQNPLSNLFLNTERSIPLRYLSGELLWYFSGLNDVKSISNFSSFWKSIVNKDNKTVNSAYGNLIFVEENDHGFTEWAWAYEALMKDIDTRQAIIRFNKPIHSYPTVKDFPCTLTGIFSIRKNKLNFTITMRSSDLILGLTYDVPFFLLLMQQMLLHINVGRKEKIELGDFTYFGVSVHIYERDFELVSKMLKHRFLPAETPTINTWLVDEDGYKSDALKLVADAVFSNQEIQQDLIKDDFLNWLYINSRKNNERKDNK